jgi:tetratricopeptide (TPR) repeat protein
MEPGAFWKGRVRRILYGAAIVSSLLVLSTYAGHWFVVVRSPGHQWKLSQRAMFQSEWDVAEIHLRNVIAAEPGNLGARLALADVYREISKEEPDDDAPEIAGAEDVRRTIFLDPPAAIEQLVEIANREPRNTIARLRLLETWRRIGRTEAATSIAKELVAIGSEDPRALFMVAAVELDAEHWGVAERLIRKLEPEPPKTSLAHLYLQTRWSDGTDNSDLINKTVPPVLQKFAQAETLQLEQLELAEATFLAYLVQTSIRHARQDSEFISRCNFALSIFDGLSTTTSDDVSARKRIDLGARFIDLLLAGLDHPKIQPGTLPAWKELQTRRNRMLSRYVDLADRTLGSDSLSPFLYDQIARAAIATGDDARAIKVLQSGLQAHEQLPAHRRAELLSLHRKAAERLIVNGEFEEASISVEQLLRHPTTAPIGHLLAGFTAFRQGSFDLARNHLVENAKSGHGSLLGSVLLCVCSFNAHEWTDALQHLDSVDKQLDSSLPRHRHWTNQFLGEASKRQLLRGFCHAQTGDDKAAEELLVKLEKTKQQTPARLIRASLLKKTGRPNDAITLLQAAMQDDPENVSVIVALAQLRATNGERQAAEFALRSFVDSHPEDVATRLALARMLSRDAAQRDQVLQLLADVRRRAPESPQGWTLAATILLTSRSTNALDDLLRQMKQQKEVAHLTPLIAAYSALQRAGLDDAALALSEADSELRQTDQWMMLSANVALAQGDTGQSLELFSQAMQSRKANPRAEQGFLQALAAAVENGPSQPTREKVIEIRKRWPEEPAAILASLVLAAKAEDFATATFEVEHLRKHDTDKGRPAFWLATILSAQGKMREAVEALVPILSDATLNDGDGTLPARMLAAKIQLFRDKPVDALRHLGSRKTDEPFEATLLRAEILRRLGRVEEAAIDLEQLVAQADKFDRGWLMLSRVYENISEGDAAARASQALERGLTHLPGNDALEDRLTTLLLRANETARVQNLAGGIFRESPRPETALRIAGLFLDHSLTEQADVWLTRARERSTEQTLPLLRFLQATCLQKQGEATNDETILRQAEATYEKLLTENPTNFGALNNLAWMKLKDFDDRASAVTLVAKIRAVIPDPSLPPGILDTIIETLRATGKTDEALKLVELSLLKHPDESLLRFHYGVLLHEHAGSNRFQQSKAIRELERAVMLGGVPAERRGELSQYLRQWKLAAN